MLQYHIRDDSVCCVPPSFSCVGMSSTASVCDTQWEQPIWLFSVYLPASPCSVPVFRKPVLQPRGPGRHNTTACEQEGHWNMENEREREREALRHREKKEEESERRTCRVRRERRQGCREPEWELAKQWQQLFLIKNQGRRRRAS